MSNEQGDRSTNQKQQASAETPLQDERAPAFALPPTITMAEVITLLDFSPEALVLLDSAGTIVLVNEQAAALFGYRQEDLKRQSLEVLLPERFHVAYVAHRLSYMSRPRPRPMGEGLDLVGRRKDGSEFSVDISVRPVLLEQALHVLGAIRDISTHDGWNVSGCSRRNSLWCKVRSLIWPMTRSWCAIRLAAYSPGTVARKNSTGGAKGTTFFVRLPLVASEARRDTETTLRPCEE